MFHFDRLSNILCKQCSNKQNSQPTITSQPTGQFNSVMRQGYNWRVHSNICPCVLPLRNRKNGCHFFLLSFIPLKRMCFYCPLTLHNHGNNQGMDGSPFKRGLVAALKQNHLNTIKTTEKQTEKQPKRKVRKITTNEAKSTTTTVSACASDSKRCQRFSYLKLR